MEIKGCDTISLSLYCNKKRFTMDEASLKRTFILIYENALSLKENFTTDNCISKFPKNYYSYQYMFLILLNEETI